jgi:hypothetical protein
MSPEDTKSVIRAKAGSQILLHSDFRPNDIGSSVSSCSAKGLPREKKRRALGHANHECVPFTNGPVANWIRL